MTLRLELTLNNKYLISSYWEFIMENSLSLGAICRCIIDYKSKCLIDYKGKVTYPKHFVNNIILGIDNVDIKQLQADLNSKDKYDELIDKLNLLRLRNINFFENEEFNKLCNNMHTSRVDFVRRHDLTNGHHFQRWTGWQAFWSHAQNYFSNTSYINYSLAPIIAGFVYTAITDKFNGRDFTYVVGGVTIVVIVLSIIFYYTFTRPNVNVRGNWSTYQEYLDAFVSIMRFRFDMVNLIVSMSSQLEEDYDNNLIIIDSAINNPRKIRNTKLNSASLGKARELYELLNLGLVTTNNINFYVSEVEQANDDNYKCIKCDYDRGSISLTMQDITAFEEIYNCSLNSNIGHLVLSDEELVRRDSILNNGNNIRSRSFRIAARNNNVLNIV